MVSLHLKFNDRGKDYSLTFSLKKWLVFPWPLPKKRNIFYQEVSCGLTISFQCELTSFRYLKQLTVVVQESAGSNSDACFCLLRAAGETQNRTARKSKIASVTIIRLELHLPATSLA